jgi:hypothetical protein
VVYGKCCYFGIDRVFILFQFQIRDALKAVRIEATKAYKQYVEELKTSQRRGRFDLEMELPVPSGFP